MRTTGDTVCYMWASQLTFNGTKTANREVVNNNSAEKRHLMDVRVNWTHIEVEVFCKLIRQFKTTHTHTHTQPQVVGNRTWIIANFTITRNELKREKNKRAATDSLCSVSSYRGGRSSRYVFARRANWSSWILRLWQLPVRQSTSTDLESNICDTLEWLMNGMKHRNKIEYWIHHARSFCGQRKKKNQQQVTKTVGRFFVLTAPKPANDIDDENEGFFFVCLMKFNGLNIKSSFYFSACGSRMQFFFSFFSQRWNWVATNFRTREKIESTNFARKKKIKLVIKTPTTTATKSIFFAAQMNAMCICKWMKTANPTRMHRKLRELNWVNCDHRTQSERERSVTGATVGKFTIGKSVNCEKREENKDRDTIHLLLLNLNRCRCGSTLDFFAFTIMWTNRPRNIFNNFIPILMIGAKLHAIPTTLSITRRETF